LTAGLGSRLAGLTYLATLQTPLAPATSPTTEPCPETDLQIQITANMMVEVFLVAVWITFGEPGPSKVAAKLVLLD